MAKDTDVGALDTEAIARFQQWTELMGRGQQTML